MRGLTDKKVFVTGAASGIGRATARRFLEERERVLCCATCVPSTTPG